MWQNHFWQISFSFHFDASRSTIAKAEKLPSVHTSQTLNARAPKFKQLFENLKGWLVRKRRKLSQQSKRDQKGEWHWSLGFLLSKIKSNTLFILGWIGREIYAQHKKMMSCGLSQFLLKIKRLFLLLFLCSSAFMFPIPSFVFFPCFMLWNVLNSCGFTFKFCVS